jgi:excisionase family DNA binding protein
MSDAAPLTESQQESKPAAPDVLNVDNLAALLHLPRSSVYEAIARGDIPGVRKIGRHLRISRAAVLAWLSGGSPVPRSRRIR